jgi:WD40 repeat protein
VVISPDARRILGASSTGRVIIWDLAGKETGRFQIESEVLNAIDFSLDANFAVCGNSEGMTIIRDTRSGRELIRCPGDSTISSAVFSRDGRRILSGSGSYSLKIDEDPINRHGRDEFTLRLWDAQTGKELRRFPGNRFSISTAAFSWDRRRVAAGCKDGTVRAWDLVSGQKLLEFTEPGGWAIARVDFSPDGRLLLVASGERAEFDQARVDREVPDRPVSASQPISDVQSANAPSIEDRMMRLLEVEGGKEIRILRGHQSPVGDAAFSPDGKRILSGGWDNSLRLWDVATGKQITSFAGHANPISRVRFSPRGKLALTGDSGGEVRVWRMPQ